MDIFKKFGCFSNLDINCDKADVYHINFSFNNEEKSQLLNYGFKDEKILDENHCLTFLGHKLKSSNLKESAKLQLKETIEDMKSTINAYNGSITLQGRKLIANSLLLSKIYSFSPACYLSKGDFSELQKIIDNFVHKKKISSGGWKYLPLKYAGLYIPEVYYKHLTLRVSLIKKMFYKISNGLTIPSWAEILIHVLKLFGFNPKILLRTLGVEDIIIVIRILRNQGLETLASLFEDIQRVNLLFQKNANIESKNRKNKNKKSNPDNSQQKPRQQVSLPEYRLRNIYAFENRSLGNVRNSQSNMEEGPDPPHKYRSMGVTRNQFCREIKKRNQLSMMTLVMGHEL